MASRKKKFEGTPPDFKLKMKAKAKGNNARSTIGAAWMNRSGGISIKLDPGVVISHRDLVDFHLTLWPTDDDGDDYESEIPFAD